MRNKLILSTFLIIFFSAACIKKNADGDSAGNILAGKWKLTEFYVDPGDGSGHWKPASVLPHPSFVEFKFGGSFVNDFSFFSYYNRYHVISDSTFWLINTMNKDSITVRYSINIGTLTLEPPCFEGCGYKYKR